MNRETGLIVGVRAVAQLATSALPRCARAPDTAPRLTTRRLLGTLSRRGR